MARNLKGLRVSYLACFLSALIYGYRFSGCFFVSGLMFQGYCRPKIKTLVDEAMQELRKQGVIPDQGQWFVNIHPIRVGIHQLQIQLRHTEHVTLDEQRIAAYLKQKIRTYKKVTLLGEKSRQPKPAINLAVNLLALIAIVALHFIFPPGLGLTIGLTVLAGAASLYSTRNYWSSFIQQLRDKQLFNMEITVTVGLALVLIHTLYHVISMPC